MVIYKGPIKDNTGKIVIPADKSFDQGNPELEKMNWLVEGVIGKVSN
jgi:simple sugar transport system substrate-binding protein